MKITLSDCRQVWEVLLELRSINPPEHISPKISGNLSYIRPNMKAWNDLTQEERLEFANKEIDLPLAELTEADLPPTMPADLYEPLNPIAKEPFENKKSELEKLMEEQE